MLRRTWYKPFWTCSSVLFLFWSLFMAFLLKCLNSGWTLSNTYTHMHTHLHTHTHSKFHTLEKTPDVAVCRQQRKARQDTEMYRKYWFKMGKKKFVFALCVYSVLAGYAGSAGWRYKNELFAVLVSKINHTKATLHIFYLSRPKCLLFFRFWCVEPFMIVLLTIWITALISV